MKIYWFKAQAPLRVLALVKYLGLKVYCIEVDMMSGGLSVPDYVALNPNKKAPTLVDGDEIFWESTAIMAHLCIKAGSDLWPAKNPSEQVEVLKWLSWNDCHWSQTVSHFYFEHIVKSTFKFGKPDLEDLKNETPNFKKFAAVLNDHLQGRNYIACERLTIADFCLASMARYYKEAEIPLESFPNIVKWLDALMQIPAWNDPWPGPSKFAKA